MEKRWNKFSKAQRLNALMLLGLPQHLVDKQWGDLPLMAAAILLAEYKQHHKK